MTDINAITIGGRVTQNITERDFGYIATGTAKLIIHIANNKSVKSNGEWVDYTSFFDVEIWGKLAEAMKPKICKGLDVVVTGTIKQDRWQDKQSGQNRSRVIISADNIRTYPKNAQNVSQNVPQNIPQNNPQDFQMSYAPQDYVPQDNQQGTIENPQQQEFQEDIPF